MAWGVRAALLLVVLADAGCASGVVPVHDVHGRPIPAAARHLPPEEIAHGMAEAAASARWRVDQSGPGRLRASYESGQHGATVDVTWTPQDYSIVLVNSRNLQ